MGTFLIDMVKVELASLALQYLLIKGNRDIVWICMDLFESNQEGS